MGQQRILTDQDLTAINAGQSSLMSRMTMYEALDADLHSRVSVLEARVVPKSAYVAKVNTPNNAVVGLTVLGLSVASASDLSASRTDISLLKSGHNAIVDLLIAQNLMQAAA